jgi:hypothetical protein
MPRFNIKGALSSLGNLKNVSVQQLAKDAVSWFGKKTRASMMNDFEKVSVPELGKMYIFGYDAKYKDTLPYWDAFPLIIVIKKRGNRFWGLNLHYLPPTLRLRFLSKLMQYTNNKKMNASTRFKLTYTFLAGVSSLKEFRPTIHSYLYDHTRTQFHLVKPEEWKYAAVLPIAKWKGAGPSTVYKHSKEML